MPNLDLDEFSLMETVRDSAKYADKIDQLLAQIKLWQKAKADAQEQMTILDTKRIETNNFVKGKLGELAARQLEHDKAADEAAARIKAQNDQMAELMRVRDDTNKRKAELDAKETELKQREAFLADQKAGIRQSLDSIEKAKDLARRQKAHIAAMPTA